MTREQYRRANKTVFPVILFILGYFTLSMLAFALANGEGTTWRTWVQLVTSILGILVATVGFVTQRETKKGAIFILFGATISYAVICLVNTTADTYVYAFPILFESMAYLNKRILIAGNSITLGVNLLRMIVNFGSVDGATQTTYILGFLTLGLVCYASIRINVLLVKFNKENTDVITESAAVQEESNKRMALVADNVTNHFDSAMGMLENLKSSIDTCNFAMSNIADSTESTADAIQRQAAMCADIQKNTDMAEQGTKAMIDASRRADEVVTEGAQVVRELKEQAKNVEEASQITVEVVERLTTRIEEVQSFVGSILNISNQTNLLALNASIEAARAGEAGKGFAVVAEEIRQLSEQTKDASNNITNIIEELNADAKRANESIENSVTSVTKQNDLIEDTRDKFEKVNVEVSDLADIIDNNEKLINDILDATGVISDNIAHLSATSEEVAAASSEGLRTAEATVADMDECKTILTGIHHLVQELKQTS